MESKCLHKKNTCLKCLLLSYSYKFIYLFHIYYRFHIVNHNGRIEKSVNAHQGACLSAQWSPDGAGLLTGG